jgi:putative membrane protein
MTTESFHSFSTLARLGMFSAILGTAALTGFAQSSTGSSSSSGAQSTGTTRASERASDRAMERSSDNSAMKRDANANANWSRQDRKFIEKFGQTNQREIALSQLALERATNPQVKAFAQKMVSDHSMAGHEFMAVASGGALTTDSSSLAASTSERASSSGSDVNTSSRKTTSGSDTSGSTASGVATRGTDATGHTASSSRERDTASATNASGTNRSSASASGTSADRTRSTASAGMDHNSATMTDMKNDRAYKKLMDKNGEDFDKAYMKTMVEEHENAVDMLEDLVKDDDRNAQLRAFANKTLPNLRAHLSEAKEIEKSLD